MKGTTRRKLDMGRRVLDFCRAFPHPSDAFAAMVARLVELLARAAQLQAEQNSGRVLVHTASGLKEELRGRMRKAHLDHLAGVARHAAAAGEMPDLAERIARAKAAGTFADFRSAAREIETVVVANRELLLQYGLSDLVLDDFGHTLDRFDGAVAQWDAGRRTHVGATTELDATAAAVVDAVEVMTGFNRLRFGPESKELSAWESASSVAASPQSSGRDADDDDDLLEEDDGEGAGEGAGEDQAQGGSGTVNPAA